MAKNVIIKAGAIEVKAEFNDTKTAQAIWDALPLKAQANRWGDEIYFSIPVHLKQEKGQMDLKVGDIGYWPAGSGFCIFFGPTPVSEGPDPRPASPCTVFGRIKGDATILRKVADGTEITVSKET